MHDGALNTVDAAICSRRSVRAFLAKEVPEETVKMILETAARAPSGYLVRACRSSLAPLALNVAGEDRKRHRKPARPHDARRFARPIMETCK